MAARQSWRPQKPASSTDDGVRPIAQSEVRPLYILVYETLLSQMASGAWKPGDLIPNEIKLSRDLGVSVGTLRKAVQILVDRDLVIRKQGRGTFVAPADDKPGNAFDTLRDGAGHLLSWTVEHREFNAGFADAGEGLALRLRARSKVLRRRRVLRDANADTCLLERCTLPQNLFVGLASDSPALDLPIGQLARQYGIVMGTFVERVMPGLATGAVAERLDVPSGTAVLELSRVAFCIKGEPVEHRQAYCRLGDAVYYSNDPRAVQRQSNFRHRPATIDSRLVTCRKSA